MKNKKIIDKEIDFSKWYSSIVSEANLIEYGLIKGTIIFKPFAWEIWSNIQKVLDSFFDKLHVKNCYMPLFIPYSDFIKESKHIEGFAPELFKVTEIGDKKLDEPYVVRPTSEIIFCHYFSKNIMSYNDLPLVLNQWCNVFRVEKNTRPFLRNSEFLWQELHGCFLNEKEAMVFAKKIIEIYKEFMENYLCIPVLIGEKTEYERFAGAKITYTIEAIMPDGQALQSGTSHYLGQNFSKNFDIKFQNKDNKFEYVHQISAGVSTRLMGALIMSHSDNYGLVLPPKISPIQIKINTLFSKKNKEINKVSKNIFNKLKKNFYVLLDDSDKSIGYKLSEGEIKGIPIQISIGEKEIKENKVSLYYRFDRSKELIDIDKINKNFIDEKISTISNCLYKKSLENLNNKIVEVNNINDFKNNILKGNVVLAYWGGSQEDEEELKKITGATSRCIKNEIETRNSFCFFTNKKTNRKVFFARAY